MFMFIIYICVHIPKITVYGYHKGKLEPRPCKTGVSWTLSLALGKDSTNVSSSVLSPFLPVNFVTFDGGLEQ